MLLLSGVSEDYGRCFSSSLDAPDEKQARIKETAKSKRKELKKPQLSIIMETMEYEQVRNLTLLFFFERLIDKNEPRTLHDLSCQFGAPGFTKEMRQIAGGSESGELIEWILRVFKVIKKKCIKISVGGSN